MRLAEQIADALTEEDAYDFAFPDKDLQRVCDDIAAHAKVIPGYAEDMKKSLKTGHRKPEKVAHLLHDAQRAIKRAYENMHSAEGAY